MTSKEILALDPKELKRLKKCGELEWNTELAITDITKAIFCKVTGYKDYKSPAQRSAIEAVMSGKDVIAIMPTSSGKSACFEFPSAVRGGTVIVVSPLISLLREQKRNAQVPAVYVSPWNINALSKEYADCRLVLVSPETLHMPKFVRFARDVLKKIQMVVIDEAHCIALWGNSFRRDYQNIGRFFDRIGQRPQVVALSATLTPSMIDTVKSVLRMRDDRLFKTYSGLSEKDMKLLFKRDNIELSKVKIKSAPVKNDEPLPLETRISDKYSQLKKDLNIMPKGKLKTKDLKAKDLKTKTKSTIVFCSFVDTVNALYHKLKEELANDDRYEIFRYHGAMESEDRMKNQNAFCDNESIPRKNSKPKKAEQGSAVPENKIMIATNAFGMGIDKGDISQIIFFEIPQDIENYAQEFGRAGRDGRQAKAVLYIYEPDAERIRAMHEREEDELEKDLSRKRFNAFMTNILTTENDSESIKELVADYFVNENKYIDFSGWQNKINARNEARGKPFRFPDELFINVCPPAYNIERGEYTVGEPIINTAYENIHDEITLSSKADHLDLMIANAVYTYGFNGKKTITAEDVCNLLLGNEKALCNKREIAEIHARIKELCETEITITRRKGLFIDINGECFREIKGHFLELEIDSKNKFVYSSAPPLFKYAEVCNGEFFVVDTSWLRIKSKKLKPLENTLENIKLSTFIAWRVHILPQYRSGRLKALHEYRKSGKESTNETNKKQFDIIRFENSDKRRKAMYDILEYENPGEAQKKIMTEKVMRILDYYKKREYIPGYKKIEERGRIVGVELGETEKPIKDLPKEFYFCESSAAKKLLMQDYEFDEPNECFTLTGENKTKLDYLDLMIAGALYTLENYKKYDTDIEAKLVWALLSGDGEKAPSEKNILEPIRTRSIRLGYQKTMIEFNNGEPKDNAEAFLSNHVEYQRINGERKTVIIPESALYDNADKDKDLVKMRSRFMNIKSEKLGKKVFADTLENLMINHFVLWQIMSAKKAKRKSVVLKLAESENGSCLSAVMPDGFEPSIYVECKKSEVHKRVLIPILSHYYRREKLIGKYTVNGDEYTLQIDKKSSPKSKAKTAENPEKVRKKPTRNY